MLCARSLPRPTISYWILNNCTKMHPSIIDSQFDISMYDYLHLTTLRTHSVRATTWHNITVMNDIGPSCFSAFGLQFMVYRWTHNFMIYIAQCPQHFLFSFLSSISRIYYMQFLQTWPYVQHLSGELYRGMNGLIQHDGHYSSGFALRNDHSLHDSYDITDITSVTEFHQWFFILFLT